MWPAWIISTYICLSKLSEPLACRLTNQYRQNCSWAPFDFHERRIRIGTTGVECNHAALDSGDELFSPAATRLCCRIRELQHWPSRGYQ